VKLSVCIVVLMLVCIAGGLAAGYDLALTREHNRLERNKALVRLTHEKVWSERKTEAAVKVAREIYASDYVVHNWSGDSTGGIAGFASNMAENRVNFPDWTEKVESIVAEGDFDAARFLSTGTQGRDLDAVPRKMPRIPTKHRFIRMPEIEFFRISNGKLAEQWDISDGWDANAQLGLYEPDHWPESVCSDAQKR
jgi:predicted ester cyclase